MVNQLLQETERLRRVPGIVFADGPAGRRARIAGTGIEVFEVIRTYRDLGADWQLLKASYDWLDDKQLHAAITYYEAYPEEIDVWLDAEAAESLEDFWRRHPQTKPAWR